MKDNSRTKKKKKKQNATLNYFFLCVKILYNIAEFMQTLYFINVRAVSFTRMYIKLLSSRRNVLYIYSLYIIQYFDVSDL